MPGWWTDGEMAGCSLCESDPKICICGDHLEEGSLARICNGLLTQLIDEGESLSYKCIQTAVYGREKNKGKSFSLGLPSIKDEMSIICVAPRDIFSFGYLHPELMLDGHYTILISSSNELSQYSEIIEFPSWIDEIWYVGSPLEKHLISTSYNRQLATRMEEITLGEFADSFRVAIKRRYSKSLLFKKLNELDFRPQKTESIDALTHYGVIDEIDSKEGKIRIRGWCYSANDSTSCSRPFAEIKVGEKSRIFMGEKKPRIDVARNFNDYEYAGYGFEVDVPHELESFAPVLVRFGTIFEDHCVSLADGRAI